MADSPRKIFMFSSLADEKVPLDISLLDEVAARFIQDGSPEAQEALESFFLRRSDAWTYVESIMEQSTNNYTKFNALKLLRDFIKQNWSILEDDPKNAIMRLIINYINHESTIQENEANAIMIDQAFVEILKYDWPSKWGTLISDLVEESHSSTVLCINNLVILKLLAEEIINYTDSGITSACSQQMMDAFDERFSVLFDLLMEIINSSEDIILLHTALESLAVFASLVSSTYFIETPLLETLANRLLNQQEFLIDVIAVYGEVANISMLPPNFTAFIPNIFITMINALEPVFSDENNDCWNNEKFITIFSQSMSSFIKRFTKHLEMVSDGQVIVLAMNWLLHITSIYENNTEPFVITIDFWKNVARQVSADMKKNNTTSLQLYSEMLSLLTRILIVKFAQPYEIADYVDDDGMQVREVFVTSDTSNVSSTMKECLRYLMCINTQDMMEAITSLITFDGSMNVSSFCWAVSSLDVKVVDISFIHSIIEVIMEMWTKLESSQQVDEAFLGFIWFCSQQTSYFNVNQDDFPKIIENLIMLLIDRRLPDAPVLSAFALNEICNKNATLFHLEGDDGSPTLCQSFISQMPSMFSTLNGSITSDVIGAISRAIFATEDQSNKALYIETILRLLVDQIDSIPFDLHNQLSIEHYIFIARCFKKMALSLKSCFAPKLNNIIPRFLDYYQITSQYAAGCSDSNEIVIMRQIKTAMINPITALSSSYLPDDGDKWTTVQICLPLIDEYLNSSLVVRVPAVVNLFAAFCSQCSDAIGSYLNDVFSGILVPTVEMVSPNYDDFYEFRVALADLMRELIVHNYNYLFQLNQNDLMNFILTIKFFIDHTQHELCQKGIKILTEFLYYVRTFSSPQYSSEFFTENGVSLVLITFKVLTDTLHNFAFNEASNLLKELLLSHEVHNNVSLIVDEMKKIFPEHENTLFYQFLLKLIQYRENHFDFRATIRDFLIKTKRAGRNDPNLTKEENEAIKNEENVESDLKNMLTYT